MFRRLLICMMIFSIAEAAVSQQNDLITVRGLTEATSQLMLYNNQRAELPVQDLRNLSVAVVHMNDQFAFAFDSIAGKYAVVKGFQISPLSADSLWFAMHDQLRLFNLVIFRISASNISERQLQFLRSFQPDTLRRVIVVVSGPDKNSTLLSALNCPVLTSTSETMSSASVAAQAIFGGISVNQHFGSSKRGKRKSARTEKIRLGYGLPASENIAAGFETTIDSLMMAAIEQHITPGAVVLFIRNGTVIMDKAYGKHTYEGSAITKVTDLFDMASVTKVTATLPAIMKLYEEKQLALDSPVSNYVQVLKTITDKKDQTIREALLHEAGYFPFIKFFEKLTPLDLSYHQSDSFPTAIAENYFLRKDYFDKVMWPVTINSPVPSRGKFVYSDISMYMMKAVAENVMHKPLDEYVMDRFYRPLGMQSAGFKPLMRFPKSRIVPTTENDNWLRNMNVTGYVNDPGAAMSGGVQGHAGLFSTSNDLGIYYQMLLNRGRYGGIKYFDTATVGLFTSRQSKVSTRALGFAKPLEGAAGGAGQPSLQAYGHSGYTGTYVWVDPEFNIVYVCLTNRVYPDDGKTYGPATFNLRAVLLDAFYNAL